MQNNPRKQDIIQELRSKRQDVPELCTEAEAVNEPHTGSGIVTDCLYLNVRKLPDINADVAVVIDQMTLLLNDDNLVRCSPAVDMAVDQPFAVIDPPEVYRCIRLQQRHQR